MPLNAVEHMSLARPEAALVCDGELDIAPVAALFQGAVLAMNVLDPWKVLDRKEVSLSR